MNATEVGIVGGGYAGMACAVALARRGVRVTVYEAARTLGGRARRVERGAVKLDNGQHILIGAYRELLSLLGEVGVANDALMRLPLTWTVLPAFLLQAARLPAPWHLAVGLMRARGLSFAARAACVRMLAWARRRGFALEQDTTVAELLRRHDQHPDAVRYLWEPLCVAALNTPAAQASAQVFLNVVRDGLNAGWSASDLLLPRIDLGALFPEPAADYVRAHGGVVRLGKTIIRIGCAQDGFEVESTEGRARHRAVIVATQPWRVPALLQHESRLAADLAPFPALAYQPIVTVYVRYARSPARPRAMTGLSGATAQWLFDRNAIAGEPGMLAAVVSARARDGLTSHDALARTVQEEIAAVFPELGTAQWCQVIEEKRATFACTPALARPRTHTAVPGLYLAGDYTEREYPATLESAVRSALRAAEAAATHLARS